MISYSFLHSKTGLTICSPHCSERFEAVRDPFISKLLHAGRIYVPFLRSERTAHVVAYGSHTTSRSSFSIPLSACGMRVIVLPPCPMTNIAFIVSGCDTWSFVRKVASDPRVLVTPGVSMNVLLAKRESIHS